MLYSAKRLHYISIYHFKFRGLYCFGLVCTDLTFISHTDDEEMNSEDEEELARMSGSFLQPKAKSKPQQKELSAKKQHSGKEMLSMSGKKQKNKATPSSQKQTPGGQKQVGCLQSIKQSKHPSCF